MLRLSVNQKLIRASASLLPCWTCSLRARIPRIRFAVDAFDFLRLSPVNQSIIALATLATVGFLVVEDIVRFRDGSISLFSTVRRYNSKDNAGFQNHELGPAVRDGSRDVATWIMICASAFSFCPRFAAIFAFLLAYSASNPTPARTLSRCWWATSNRRCRSSLPRIAFATSAMYAMFTARCSTAPFDACQRTKPFLIIASIIARDRKWRCGKVIGASFAALGMSMSVKSSYRTEAANP